jgi:hypothetical protein
VGAISLFITISLVLWLTNYSRANPRPERLAPKSLEAYREQFRRSDGSLPTDAELRAILQAKGIPYVETCTGSKNCSSATPFALSQIPKIDFSATNLTSERREALQDAIATTLAHQLEAMRRISPDLGLERVAVDSGMKLHLYFNKEFQQIADEETMLSEFSEGLHGLGMAGLRGSVVYIAGQPLGVYLQKKDAERNQKARAESPEPGGEDRR